MEPPKANSLINWKERAPYKFREAQPQQGPHPGISGIGIFTAGRPALLDRALRSYVAHSRANRRELEYVVFDDSKDKDARLASLEVAQTIRSQFKVHIRFSGFEERAAYVGHLSEESGVSPEILTYGLLRPKGYTLGQNRNALLLDTVGSLFFGADDDTLCAIARRPRMAEQGLKMCAGSDPSEFWCFRDVGEARNSVRFVDDDFLEGHDQLLGSKVCGLDPGVSVVASSDEPPVSSNSQQIGSRRNNVTVTVNGLLGDCAWSSPFGLWHEPMGYLAFDGASLERLIHTEEFYRQATLSRQVLRVTSSPVVADVSFSMLTFWGLDNRELLPPNVPNHRGQDLIFGQVLWKCFNRALVGHVPLALVHDPRPPRRFWPGEMTRSAAGIDLCRLMIEGLRLCELQDELASPAMRLKALGQHLVGLAELSDRALGKRLKESLHDSNWRFGSKLRERAQQMMERHGFYAGDVIHYFGKLKTAEAREDYWLPLDMFSSDGSGVAGRVHQAFRQYGKLLDAWPTIVKGAKALRRKGLRLSRPV
jgi:hypothetical protein